MGIIDCSGFCGAATGMFKELKRMLKEGLLPRTEFLSQIDFIVNTHHDERIGSNDVGGLTGQIAQDWFKRQGRSLELKPEDKPFPKDHQHKWEWDGGGYKECKNCGEVIKGQLFWCRTCNRCVCSS